MPRTTQPKRASQNIRHNPISRQLIQTARPNNRMLVINQSSQAAGRDLRVEEDMTWLTYVSLGMIILRTDCSTQPQRRECELLQRHFRQWDAYGGIAAVDKIVITMGFDATSVGKPGMPLKQWCEVFTIHPINDSGVDMAKYVNGITNAINASIAGHGITGDGVGWARGLLDNFGLAWDKATSLPQDLFFKLCRSAIQQIPMPEAEYLGQLLIDTCTHFWGHCITSTEDSFLDACHFVLEKTGISKVSTLGRQLSVACQMLMGDNRWVAVLASVMVGTGLSMLQQRRPRRNAAPNAVPTGGTDDDEDDASGQLVPAFDTHHPSHGTQLGSNNDQPRQDTWCEVTVQDPHRAAKAPALKRWCLLQGEDFSEGVPRYLVREPQTRWTAWCYRDAITFLDGNGYNLRPRGRSEA